MQHQAVHSEQAQLIHEVQQRLERLAHVNAEYTEILVNKGVPHNIQRQTLIKSKQLCL